MQGLGFGHRLRAVPARGQACGDDHTLDKYPLDARVQTCWHHCNTHTYTHTALIGAPSIQVHKPVVTTATHTHTALIDAPSMQVQKPVARLVDGQVMVGWRQPSDELAADVTGYLLEVTGAL